MSKQLSLTETPAAYYASLVDYMDRYKQVPIGWRYDLVFEHLKEKGILTGGLISPLEERRSKVVSWAREYCLDLQQQKKVA